MSRPKFSIPILPSLLTRYDVPAPIIIPPGADPSFFNPNPQPPSPMDVDPCVTASWGEIVTANVDLTASEHAGVTLSEPPTMLSTTSTNSVVVALQALNDAAVTSTEAEKTNFIACEDRDKAFNKHMGGKIHLKNQQTPSPAAKKNQDLENVTHVSKVVEQETRSSVANDTLDQASEKKSQDLLQKESASEYESLFFCAIPEPGRYYKKIATVEVDESLFKNLVPNRTSQTSVQPSTQNRSNSCDICKITCNGNCFDAHVAGKQHQRNLKVSEKAPMEVCENGQKLKDCKLVWCGICKASCAANAYDKHASGKKHIKNLQSLNKGEVNKANSASCELCGISCSSQDILNIHISGKKHQKKLKTTKQQYVPILAPVAKTPMLEEGEIVFSEGIKRKDNGSLSLSEKDADTKRQKMMNKEEACGLLVTCKVCNVGCNGFMAYNTHVAGFEHSTMLLKQAKGG